MRAFSVLLWLVTILAALVGGIEIFFALNAPRGDSAVQQIGKVVMGVSFAVVPYVIARAFDAMAMPWPSSRQPASVPAAGAMPVPEPAAPPVPVDPVKQRRRRRAAAFVALAVISLVAAALAAEFLTRPSEEELDSRRAKQGYGPAPGWLRNR